MRVSSRTSRAYRAPALYGEPRFALPPHTPNCVGYGDLATSGGGKPPHPRSNMKNTLGLKFACIAPLNKLKVSGFRLLHFTKNI